MNNIKISVITAAWRVDGLKKVIRCLNDQIFRNFEHLIINDNNPDVREFLKKNDYFENNRHRHVIDSFVRLHYYGGISRNIGVLASFSYLREQERNEDKEFICFFDDDNFWEKDHLQSLVEILKNHPNATLIGSDMIKIGVQDSNWKKLVPCVIKHGHCDLGNFLYKAILFRKYGVFYPRLKRKHKFDIELLEKMNVGEKENIYFTNKPTFLMNYKKR